MSRCYERGAILITSNRSVGEWGSVFGDPVVATAILDRLLHHSTVITIRGDRYRLREKRRSGLLQKGGTCSLQPTSVGGRHREDTYSARTPSAPNSAIEALMP